MWRSRLPRTPPSLIGVRPAENKIGTWARKSYSVSGQELNPADYPAYLAGMVPSAEDREFLRGIFKDNDWIEPKRAEDGN